MFCGEAGEGRLPRHVKVDLGMMMAMFFTCDACEYQKVSTQVQTLAASSQYGDMKSEREDL